MVPFTARVLLVGAALLVAGCSSVVSSQDPRRSAFAGDAGLVLCAPGQTVCSGACVDLKANAQNCGACGRGCELRELCFQGDCALSCPKGWTECNGACVDLTTNTNNCGQCGNSCSGGQSCQAGACVCAAPLSKCGSECVDTQSDAAHCGACGKSCSGSEVCNAGKCEPKCNQGALLCSGTCVDPNSDVGNCGSCGNACSGNRLCAGGVCSCPSPFLMCGQSCVDLENDNRNCGSCLNSCATGMTCRNGICQTLCVPGEAVCGVSCANLNSSKDHCGSCFNKCTGSDRCVNGACEVCDSATTDCDGDGWTGAEGDLCDKPGPGCGDFPELVNPGALEIMGNGIDDNLNGLIDEADLLDLGECDWTLPSNSQNPIDYARALGICRDTEENPTRPQDRTWGLISAHLVRADGSPLSFSAAKSIRSGFGKGVKPQEGGKLVVLSTGVAADSIQTMPGPNQGPGSNVSTEHGWNQSVNIGNCNLPFCISDWFNADNLPVKKSRELPVAPECGQGSAGPPDEANDSVMLVLRMRAPTNVRSLSFNAYFFSAEYPEYVCSDFNDQFVALIDTPGGTPSPIPNPPDKNLMTYVQGGKAWPIGINIAKGTDLFRVCESQAQNPACWDSNVSVLSCSQGAGALKGSGFEAPSPGQCTWGGGTDWLKTVGNIRPGEIVELRIAIWDVGDQIFDSTAVIDGFKWDTALGTPGTSG